MVSSAWGNRHPFGAGAWEGRRRRHGGWAARWVVHEPRRGAPASRGAGWTDRSGRPSRDPGRGTRPASGPWTRPGFEDVDRGEGDGGGGDRLGGVGFAGLLVPDLGTVPTLDGGADVEPRVTDVVQ